jgi:hypothetical protein
VSTKPGEDHQRLVDMAGSQQKAFDKLIEVVDFDPDLALSEEPLPP